MGADIASFAVRLTKDNRLILTKSRHLDNNAHQERIRTLSLREIRRHYAGSNTQIETVESLLKALAGSVFLEIRLSEQAAVHPLLESVRSHLIHMRDWQNIIFTSDNPFVLAKIRLSTPHAQLCLRHHRYPLTFVTWQPLLKLSAVGFHRLHINTIAVEAAKKLDLLSYAYTVNRPKALKKLATYGIDAVASDTPEYLLTRSIY